MTSSFQKHFYKLQLAESQIWKVSGGYTGAYVEQLFRKLRKLCTWLPLKFSISFNREKYTWTWLEGMVQFWAICNFQLNFTTLGRFIFGQFWPRAIWSARETCCGSEAPHGWDDPLPPSWVHGITQCLANEVITPHYPTKGVHTVRYAIVSLL